MHEPFSQKTDEEKQNQRGTKSPQTYRSSHNHHKNVVFCVDVKKLNVFIFIHTYIYAWRLSFSVILNIFPLTEICWELQTVLVDHRAEKMAGCTKIQWTCKDKMEFSDLNPVNFVLCNNKTQILHNHKNSKYL